LGILGRERFEYWRLLLWTLMRRPRQLPLAITLSIYGHHFRRICELYILRVEKGGNMHTPFKSEDINQLLAEADELINQINSDAITGHGRGTTHPV
jgi:hypothetical protein